MRLRQIYFFVISALSIGPVCAATSVCRYSYQSDQVKIEWTGYKTTKKIAVSGVFENIHLDGFLASDSIDTILKSLMITIDTSSVNSANPARDTNLVDHFFKLFKGYDHVQGKVIKSSVTVKNFKILLEMNGKKQPVLVSYELTPTGRTDSKGHSKTQKFEFVGKGSIDVLKWGLKKSVDGLNRVCSAQHSGDDHVSKTWSEVAFKISVPFEKQCQ